MAGRKKLPDHLLKYPRKGTNKGLRKPYKTRTADQTGVSYKEPLMIKSFWKDYTVAQIQSMSDEDILQAIDEYLEGFIYRQTKRNKNWDFPVKPEYLRIDPNWKR